METEAGTYAHGLGVHMYGSKYGKELANKKVGRMPRALNWEPLGLRSLRIPNSHLAFQVLRSSVCHMRRAECVLFSNLLARFIYLKY